MEDFVCIPGMGVVFAPLECDTGAVAMSVSVFIGCLVVGSFAFDMSMRWWRQNEWRRLSHARRVETHRAASAVRRGN